MSPIAAGVAFGICLSVLVLMSGFGVYGIYHLMNDSRIAFCGALAIFVSVSIMLVAFSEAGDDRL